MKKRIVSVILILCLSVTSASALTARQARNVLREHYIDEIPEEILALTTVEEILDALGDPYTAYYTEEEYGAFRSALEDEKLVGMGVKIIYLNEGLFVSEVAPDSPAGEAGLQSGDYIIALDGQDIRGAGADSIDAWLYGEEGSQVRLTVLRGTEQFEVDVVRRQVVFPTVILENIENRVGWISCSAFGSTTFQHFYDILSKYDNTVDEWVVDLRGNSGGDVYAAAFSAGCFVGSEAVAYFRDRQGLYYRCQSSPELIEKRGYYEGDLLEYKLTGRATSDPVPVLTDRYTASAAEMFAAILREAGAGLIIGERTYGKGVAQTIFDENYSDDKIARYFREKDALKVTTERIFYAGGATNDKVGVLPHFMVDAELADEVAKLLAAEISEEEDVLLVRNLDSYNSRSESMAIPLRMAQAPEHAAAVKQILEALPAEAFCVMREQGELRRVSIDEAAEILGVVPEKRTFSDVSESLYAEEINSLGVYGIASGGGDGTFRPKEAIDRASLCALLVKAMRYPAVKDAVEFADVPADAWYAPYVNAAYRAGLIEGDENGLFHPEDPVSHEQFLVILGQVAQWLNMDCYENMLEDGIYGTVQPDEEALEQLYANFSKEARKSVWLCDDAFAWADLSEVDASAATLREEAAASVFNLLQYSGIVPDP